MNTARDGQDASPYASAAETYWDAGWTSPLPIPARSKRIVVAGWTGWHGIRPSYADVQAWIEEAPRSNIALRLPATVLGIDVDNYGDKPGAASLAAAQATWGPLPATWRTTSRDDGISGIRLFTVPEGLEWPGQVPGGGIETIHVGHRYAMAPPSIHPEGRVYRWINPDGLDTLSVPAVADLPWLPAAWVTGLARGRHQDEPSVDMPRAAISEWLGAREQADLCGKMRDAAHAVGDALSVAGSRHEVLLAGLLNLVRLADLGHGGLETSLRFVRQRFVDLVTADRSRSESEAMAECERALAGAVAMVAAAPSPAAGGEDPCNPSPLAKLFAAAVASPRMGGPVAAATASASSPGPIRPTPSHLPAPGAVGAPEPAAPDAGPVPADPAAPTAGSVSPAPEDATSWLASSMELALAGQHAEGPPTVLARSDGQHLLYAGRINGIIGPSESGKSWIALEAVRQVLAAGHRALLLDFEDSVPGVVQRLLALGLAPEVIGARFHYIGPDEPLGPRALADLQQSLALLAPADLVVLDGFNAAMTLLGLELMSNKDVTTFHQSLLKLLLGSGAALVYVDHTPKNDAEGDSRGGIGAQAKRAMTTGTILRCAVKTPFGRNQSGIIAITVDKDRSGHVREVSPGQKVGAAFMTSSTVDGANFVQLTIKPPDPVPVDRSTGTPRYTGLMTIISRYLAPNPAGLSDNQIRRGVSGNTDAKHAALQMLVAEGYVIKEGFRHTLHHPYVEAQDPHLFPSPQPPPTSPTGDATAWPKLPSPNPPFRGVGGRGGPVVGTSHQLPLPPPSGEVDEQ